MRVLDDLALISGPSSRSRAYAQQITAAGFLPGIVLYQPGEEWRWEGLEIVEVDVRGDGNLFGFRPNETARATLEGAGVPSLELPVAAIDDDANLAVYRELSAQVLMFSGYRTGILREAALETGKRFLHVHGGFVPAYRGSTTFYYSILSEGMMGASAIWMDSGIDTGPVLVRRRYPTPQGIDIDYIFDPLVRADTLAEVLTQRANSGTWPSGKIIPTEQGETFHKVHPVLKHLALRRVGLVQSKSF